MGLIVAAGTIDVLVVVMVTVTTGSVMVVILVRLTEVESHTLEQDASSPVAPDNAGKLPSKKDIKQRLRVFIVRYRVTAVREYCVEVYL